jgi:hypothetical protein
VGNTIANAASGLSLFFSFDTQVAGNTITGVGAGINSYSSHFRGLPASMWLDAGVDPGRERVFAGL